MNYNSQKTGFINSLAKSLKERTNPSSYKEACFGFVQKADAPVIVTTAGGAITLAEGDNLFISETFRKRCDIDKTLKLTVGVPGDLTSARAIEELHTDPKIPCTFPQAINYLALAIEKVTAEVLDLKCELAVGDKVLLIPADIDSSYFLVDKIIPDED